MRPNVAVISTGGTIASTGGGEAATPEKGGSELVDAVPEITEHARVSVRELAQVASFNMDLETIADIGDATAEAIADGAEGVVVTHGTDTMEESAYALDLTREFDAPVVFTGAQRRPDELSSDGPSNMLTAIRAASHQRFRDAGGIYVAFDMELHSPRDVTKSHTSALGAFESPDKGPIASVTRDGLRVHRPPGSYSDTLQSTRTDADVMMIKSAASVDARQLEFAVNQGVDGIVIEGTGLGNITSALGRAVDSVVEEGIPVVVTSRCQGGATAPVYGTPGGGRTLIDNGAVQANDLSAQKARLKLAFALAEAEDPGSIGEYF
ncbi:asparaginase [Halorientalis pallida]|uniref:L-asparaginase n=1 Tax=Halorientalis pallida TaxID=2479928 RepID=A0A498KT20_9EURY|nr:asparaginase [Halorientalis pallida]RXK47927.1 asparaginase [Halorientalis pallida]